LFAFGSLQPTGNGLLLVSTKNAVMLSNLIDTLKTLKSSLGGKLPVALVIDDEADQASLDTRTSQRAKKPSIDPGRINDLITQIRQQFDCHTYLQVTATPQALFLQDLGNLYRPEFTILIEPGKGYIGGNTFFSLEWGRAEELIRYVSQSELDELLDNRVPRIPDSLKKAICIFYVGATIKYLQDKDKEEMSPSDLVYSFLCHISQKKKDHGKAEEVIKIYCKYLREGMSSAASTEVRVTVEQELRAAYDDLSETVTVALPSFNDILDQLQSFMVGTEIQVLNSNNDEQNQPRYDRRYNILIGGNKLARGVTIKNLLVTYYGRQAKRTNMDTMLQHARMYGYRERDLDVTRLFVTPEVEERFRLINESEQALREVVERYPNEEYRGILIGANLNPTRRNVLNPNNIGAYAGGISYFPAKPLFRRSEVKEITDLLNRTLDSIYPDSRKDPIQITIDQMIELVRLTKSDLTGSGLWNDDLIVTALETLRKEQRYNNTAFLIVRRDRGLTRPDNGNLRSVLGPGDLDFAKANKSYPTLYMYRQIGSVRERWDGMPFWIPVVAFPDGQYALMFNLDRT